MVLAVRRNSPSSGRPSTSSAMLLRQVALGDGADHARHLARRVHQVVDQRVDGVDRVAPRSRVTSPQRGALLELAFLADDADSRASSCCLRAFSSTTSLKASATLPCRPGH